MDKSTRNVFTNTRFCRQYEFHQGQRVVMTVTDSGVQPLEMVRDKAEQLQALLMVMGDGWDSMTEMHESLGRALCRLASETAGDIVGLSELEHIVGTKAGNSGVEIQATVSGVCRSRENSQ